MKPPLQSRLAYDGIRALVEAGRPLDAKELAALSGRANVDRLIRILRRRDEDWAAVLITPGVKFRAGVYAIAQPAKFEPLAERIAADVEGLSAPDRKQLEALLTGVYQTCEHPDFTKRRAELLAEADQVQPADVSSFIVRFSRLGLEEPKRVRKFGLSGEEEQSLFMALHYCRHRVKASRDQMIAGDVSTAAALELLDWHRRSLRYRDEIVRHHLHLAGAITAKFAYRHSFDEALSEAQLALIEAVDQFKLAMPYRFGCRLRFVIQSRIVCAHARRARYQRHVGEDEFAPEVVPARVWRTERKNERREHYLDELRRILSENRAGLTQDEMTVIRRRITEPVPDDGHGDRHGVMISFADLSRVLRRKQETLSRLFRSAIAKIKAALDRAMSRARVLELVAQRQQSRGAAMAV